MRSSVKPSNAAIDNQIDRTIKTWQPRAERDVSREDAREIVENVNGLFSILVEWSLAEMSELANDTGKLGDTDSNGEVRHDR